MKIGRLAVHQRATQISQKSNPESERLWIQHIVLGDDGMFVLYLMSTYPSISTDAKKNIGTVFFRSLFFFFFQNRSDPKGIRVRPGIYDFYFNFLSL